MFAATRSAFTLASRARITPLSRRWANHPSKIFSEGGWWNCYRIDQEKGCREKVDRKLDRESHYSEWDGGNVCYLSLKVGWQWKMENDFVCWERVGKWNEWKKWKYVCSIPKKMGLRMELWFDVIRNRLLVRIELQPCTFCDLFLSFVWSEPKFEINFYFRPVCLFVH